MKRNTLALLALASLLAAGCSRLSLGWHVAPFWLRHEAARWLGAGPDEKAALKQDVDAYLHRLAIQAGPPASAWCRHLAKLVSQGQDPAAVDCFFDDGLKLWRSIEELGVAPASAWLARRPAERAKALRAGFDEQAKLEASRPAGDRAAGDRFKRLQEGLADWVGDLSEAQQAKLGDFAAHSSYPSAALALERRKREQALLDSLARSQPQPVIEKQLRAWWLTPEQDWDRALQKAVQDYRQGLRAALGGLLASLTPQQRDHLSARLLALADDLDAISRKAAVQ